MRITNASLPDNKEYFYPASRLFNHDERLVRAFLHQDYQIGMHIHDFMEINVVFKGKGRHYMLGRSFEVSRGHVFVIPPNIKHGYVNEGGLDVHHILIHDRFLQKNEFQLKTFPGYLMFFTVEPYFRLSDDFRHVLKLSDESCEHLFSLLSWLNSLDRSDAIGKDQEMETIASCFMTHLCFRYEEFLRSIGPSPKNEVRLQSINDVVRFMREHLGKKITLGKLAKIAGAQREYFCREFRKATGYSPMDYLTQLRVNEAKRLLTTENESISAIALETGFYDSSHFSKVFKKTTGVSPSDFRR